MTSQLLFGERLQVLESSDAWYRVKNQRDRYVGYVQISDLIVAEVEATHWVAARATLLFSADDIKSPVVRRLGFGAEVIIKTLNFPWAELDSGFIWGAHLLPCDEALPLSPLAVAQRFFTGAPYLWGGRSPDGIDCSGLVQMAYRACGYRLPRDSGDQEQAIEQRVDYARRQAQDVVFWPGHVGLLVNSGELLHATAHTVDCRSEPLAAVEARAGSPSSIRRLPLTKHRGI